jgi:MYXO-CTERM domain-containing protein
VASDPEELLRSIERTREELAHTVDTIAGRLDPKRAAKRGVDAVRDGVTTVVDGARVKLHLGPESTARSESLTATASTAKTASDAAVSAVSAGLAQVGPLAKRVPKPAATGMAALVAFAAIVAVRRRRR